MANVFSRSWEITKLCFNVISKDKEILMFPIMSGIFSILFLVALIFPTYVLNLVDYKNVNPFLLLFGIYLVLAFIATFFSVATVYTAKIRFEGGDATFGESIKFAFSKVHIIFLWAIVSAVVGIILRLIEEAAERAGGIGEIVLIIVRSIVGAAWAIATLFVIPILVYKGHTPFKAIGESTRTVKKTWGDSLTMSFGLGLMQFLFIVLGIVGTIVLALIFGAFGPAGVIFAVGLGIIFLLSVIILFNAMDNIYATALYIYAETGEMPKQFHNSEAISHAFEKKEN